MSYNTNRAFAEYDVAHKAYLDAVEAYANSKGRARTDVNSVTVRNARDAWFSAKARVIHTVTEEAVCNTLDKLAVA